MKRPVNKSDVYAFVFLTLGLGFIFFGCLSLLNIVKPTSHSSVQDPILAGQIFSLLGAAFCVVQSVFRIFSIKQAKLHNELISICYNEKIYHNKSCLIWDKPNLSKDNKIDIFVNDDGHSTLEL